QDKFDLGTRAHANHYVLTLARSLFDAAERLDISPENLIERLDSVATVSPPEVLNTTIKSDDVEDNQDNLAADSDDDDSATEQNLTPSVTTTDVLFEKMDRQLDQMNKQQQSLADLTRAVGDLVLTLSSQPQPQPQSSSPPKSTKVRPAKSALLPQKTATKPPSEVSGRKLHSHIVRQRVNQYIDAIMAFNDVLDRPHGEKWAISVAGLKRLAGCGQHPVYAVLQQRQPEIDEHHRKHQLSSTHNKKDSSFPTIEKVISL
ncbi:MAG: hypothetical protein AAGE96_26010, partial [Cyanobacteria bacterium P01_G01_bin.19]